MATLLVLLSMVFVAAFSAAVRNLTRFDIAWANALLTDMEWADSFLRKATMWLAFLGASQATYYRKHISIDVLTRLAPIKPRYMMHATAGVCAAIITFALAYSLASAVKINLAERPVEYEMLAENGSKHVCDASEAELKTLEGLEAPKTFCAFRSVLRAVGVTAETPGAAFQLVVPFMFVIMGLRFLGIGIGSGLAVLQGEEAMRRLEEIEHARLAAVHASVSGDAPPAELEEGEGEGEDAHAFEDEQDGEYSDEAGEEGQYEGDEYAHEEGHEDGDEDGDEEGHEEADEPAPEDSEQAHEDGQHESDEAADEHEHPEEHASVGDEDTEDDASEEERAKKHPNDRGEKS
jgi:TRAP-type C4-dicarboxylate transport system permease small subunit